MHPESLLGGLWKPHQVRVSCDVLSTVPHGDPQPGSWPPAELSQAGAVTGARTRPGKGPGVGHAAFQRQDRAGPRAVYSTLSTSRGLKRFHPEETVEIWKVQCSANTTVQLNPRQPSHGWPMDAEMSSPVRKNNPRRWWGKN